MLYFFTFAFIRGEYFQNKKSRLFRSRDSLNLKKKCSKEDSNLHGSPH